ncbi:nuclear transport factor 2 family protein [Ruegeria arenilitoris]|uniref:nuclear transport factor 2 family protein n=1 Tax=Ruegeria arenilitoris TaxID=1173585 RepID=UPI00147F84E7|nr:nuclear transport factor 2 family protein [Ruegeria arenilitoris]
MKDRIATSPELEAIVQRWVSAFGARDTDVVVNLFSRSKALTYLGSADDEFWTGDTLRTGYKAYIEDVPKFIINESNIVAHEVGSVGWAIWRAKVYAPKTEKAVDFRISFVFILEDAVWRIVQIHNSNPVSNIEAMGFETQSFDDLLLAVDQEELQQSPSGIASIMFTDIADSSTIAQTIGDHLWNRAVRYHLENVEAEIDRTGGRMIKSLGDGTMSAFPTARSALEAAQSIQRKLHTEKVEPRLRARIGIHTGDVLENDGDFFGTVVNKAARIASMCAPDEIRVSDATRIMVGSGARFSFSDAATVPLKGLKGAHKIYKLDWQK